MTATADESFNPFVTRWRKKLRGIAYKTAYDEGEDAHPLARTLASDAGRNAVDALLEREADRSLEVALQAHGSLAAA